MDNQIYPVWAQTKKGTKSYLIGIFGSREEADCAIDKCRSQLSEEEQKAIYWLTGESSFLNEINIGAFVILKNYIRQSSSAKPLKTRAEKFKEVFGINARELLLGLGNTVMYIPYRGWLDEPYEEPKDLVQLALDEFSYNGHTLREWVNILTSGPIDGIWLCDPSKNSHCSSENCYKNGGCCYHTVYRQYAMFPMEENEKE